MTTVPFYRQKNKQVRGTWENAFEISWLVTSANEKGKGGKITAVKAGNFPYILPLKIHLLIKSVLIRCLCIPGTILGTPDKSEEKSPCPRGTYNQRAR